MAEPLVDTEQFLIEMQERPALWNSSLKEYNDKIIRKSLWEEIVERFGDGVQDVETKKQLGIQLQKKWKNLRDSYFREVRRLKDVQSGTAAPKRASYIYFNHLHFLKAVPESCPKTSNVERPTEPEASNTSETPSSQTNRPPQKKPRTDDYVGVEMVNVLKASLQARQDSEHHDSDKLFLLSLLDDFKNIPHNFKCTAKIEIMKLIMKFQPHQQQPVFSPCHPHYDNYPCSRPTFENAGTPVSSHHPQRGSYSNSYPKRPPTSGRPPIDHSAPSPETLSQDSDYMELY